MKVTKNRKKLEREKYSLETTKYVDENGLIFKRDNLYCGDNCEIWCCDDCRIFCGDNCRIKCLNNCDIYCCECNCRIECLNNCKIIAAKGTKIIYYCKDKILTYKFKERKIILCKDGEFVEK